MTDFNIGDIVIDPWVFVVIIIVIILFLAVTVVWGIRAHRMKVSAGKEEMVGKSARVITELNPRGTVFIEGEQWTAISESGPIAPDKTVTVTRVDGLKLYVTGNQ